MLRHSTVQTTQNIYMQILEAQVREVVDAVHGELVRRPDAAGQRKSRRLRTAANLSSAGMAGPVGEGAGEQDVEVAGGELLPRGI